jgi:hypothetical protein
LEVFGTGWDPTSNSQILISWNVTAFGNRVLKRKELETWSLGWALFNLTDVLHFLGYNTRFGVD